MVRIHQMEQNIASLIRKSYDRNKRIQNRSLKWKVIRGIKFSSQTE